MTDDNEQALYVCPRTEELETPNPAAVTGHCDMCHVDIYMMPHAPTHMPKVCWPCATKEMAKELKNDPTGTTITFLPGKAARQVH